MVYTRRGKSLTSSVINYAVSQARTAVKNQMRKAVSETKTMTKSKKKFKRATKYTRGRYAGKVKGKKLRTKIQDICQRTGFLHTVEVNGIVADPDICYITHSTYSGMRPTHEILMHALLRKVFAKAGCNITGVNEKIRGYNAGINGGDSDGWKICLVWTDILTGVKQWVQYETGLNETLYTITGSVQNGLAPNASNIMNALVEFSVEFGGAKDRIFESLELYDKDGNAGNFWRIASTINLKLENIHCYSQSSIKFQNRTKSGGTNETDNVNNNPLVGRIYEFTSGVPRPKVENTYLLERITDGFGVELIRGAEFAANVQGLKEVPRASFFANCNKSISLKLQPGDIKKNSIRHSFKMLFNDFLLNYALLFNNNGVGKTAKATGKCAMLALEDMINIDAGDLVTLAYEVNRIVGIYTSSGKAPSSIGHLYQLNRSNLPPV